MQVDAWLQDIRTFKARKPYDVVICHGVLHFLRRNELYAVIGILKEAAGMGGINVVAVFDDRIPLSDDLAPLLKGLVREGELEEIYADWNIELAESHVFDDEHRTGMSHHHSISKIVARNGLERRGPGAFSDR